MYDVTQLRIERVAITLRLTADVHLPVYHGRSLHGLVSRALDLKPFPRTIAVRCAEWWSFPRRAGSLYRFGITGLGTGCALLEDAQARIGRRGSTPHRGGRGSLDGCFEVESFEHAACESLAADVDALLGEQGDIDLRFRTPLYLRRPRHNIRGGLAYINREDFSLQVLLAAAARRVEEVVSTKATDAHTGTSYSMPISSSGNATADASAAINLNYRESPTADRSTVRPAKGIQGLVRVKDLPETWLPSLVFAAYAQLGTGIGYGQGQVVVERGSTRVGEWCPPAGTLFDRMLEPTMLAAAEQRVIDRSDVHHDGWLPSTDGSVEGVDKAVAELRAHHYEPSPLIGTVIPKKTGGVRALAYPPLVDRVLQRAAHDALDADLDLLFEESGYAYRNGRSVRQAATAIERYHARGFEWVVDAGIASFFDNVDWTVLAERIRSALGADPIGDALIDWMKAPVRFAGHRYSRVRGLPQGSPLSPLLANLYLDSLDEHLSANGFAVIRYADDFIVLCRSADTAMKAKNDAEQELTSLRLSLNPDKTRNGFDDGLHFMGIQFGMANHRVEPGTPSEAGLHEDRSVETTAEIPAGSWLVDVPANELKRVLDHPLTSCHRSKARKTAPGLSNTAKCAGHRVK